MTWSIAIDERPTGKDKKGQLVRQYRITRDSKTVAVTYTQAHANLIAAAPEMLEALETLIIAAEVDGWPPGWGLVQEKASAAIAKAEGRS